MIVVQNKSTLVNNDAVMTMTRACATQVRYHAAPAWKLQPVPVIYMNAGSDVPPGSWVISVLDDADQADALGWHTEDQGDVIYGRVFAKPVLDHGGDALTQPLSVASVLSHEVLETFVDPHVNLLADDTKGTAYALEVGDPVESDSYTISIRPRGQTLAVPVTVSNFALPAWFDPLATSGPYDYMGKVTKPFQMTSGGYVVYLKEGQWQQKTGESYPAWKLQTKKSDTSRTARRVKNVDSVFAQVKQ